MQELNPQRKAFLDMVAWSEGTDNGRQPTRNHGYDVIVGGELFTDYSDHQRGYGSKWDAIRERVLKHDKGLCQLCLRAGVVREAKSRG